MAFLSSLTLQNFRNYSKSSFTFSKTTTIVVGPNAIGKTNLLEAVYILATGRSFRADVEREMIQYREEVGRVLGKIVVSSKQPFDLAQDRQVAREEKISLEIVITTGQVGGQKAPYKKFLVDNTSKRMIDYVGMLKCVVFWPQDLELVTHSPSRRRKYLDSVLSQVDREYRRTFSSYEKGLRSRNRILENIREGQANRNELLFWDQLLIKHGGYITNKREEFITFINDQKLTIDGGIMELMYDHSIISEARLEQYKQAEVGAGTTLVGPHRDDFIINIQHSTNNKQLITKKDLHTYGSRGEQRLAVLWLKLSELNFIEKKTETRPILLLDDIFSELDHSHRKFVLDIIPHQQTIITTTDIHLIEDNKKQMDIIQLPKNPS